jgi:hypothetical protein
METRASSEKEGGVSNRGRACLGPISPLFVPLCERVEEGTSITHYTLFIGTMLLQRRANLQYHITFITHCQSAHWVEFVKMTSIGLFHFRKSLGISFKSSDTLNPKP